MEEFLILIYDGMYVNNNGLVYDNNCFRLDSLMD